MKIEKLDIVLLVQRVFVAGLLFPHGIAKSQNGIEYIIKSLGFFGNAVFIGQIIAPILLILGVVPRIASLLMMITMFVSITFHQNILSFNEYGGLEIELNLMYIVGVLATLLLGSGKYSFYNRY